MKLFNCAHCGQVVNFENYFCVQCNSSLGFDPINISMLSSEPDAGNGLFQERKIKNNQLPQSFKYCANKTNNVCNWLLPADSEFSFCIACNLNRTIPDLSQPDHWEKWSRIEVAKHRLIYSLLRFQLPVISKFQDEQTGLAFDFKADKNKDGSQRLLTGHELGIITLNIEEADDAIREMVRNRVGEVYRTILGHFRHEIGHYYWDQLIKDSDWLQQFRNCFGDETIDYAESLKQHYNKADDNSWSEKFISAYASAHPWEDWAETWAHYMHIVDTMETAYSFGVTVNPGLSKKGDELDAKLNIDPYATKHFDDIIERWIPLTFVMNSLNRSMGMNDSYPFVINDEVKNKLNFIHETIRRRAIDIL